MMTAASMPARAEYAAALADVFPVDAHTTTLAPSSAALEIAIVMPRSLNEPVGFAPSTFSKTRASTSSEMRGASTSGVLPSSSVTTGVRSLTGSRSRYASMTPRQPFIFGRFAVASLFSSHHAEHRADAPDHIEVADVVNGRGQRGLACEVRHEDEPGALALPLLLHRLDRHV